LIDENCHLLVITDDGSTLALIHTTFGPLGCRITYAANAAAAEACLNAGPVSVIVCERRMDGGDIFHFLERWAIDPKWRHLPLVSLGPSGSSTAPFKATSDYEIALIRPINPMRLSMAVATLLERVAIFRHRIREDALTKLLNRMAFETELGRELHRIKRYQRVGSLIFLDLDNFKGVNDRFGHAVGDQTLIYFAGVILENIRNVDLAGRIGGEEFAIFLPETKEEGAMMLGNRLLETCRTGQGAPEGVTVSFSAGVAEAPRDGMGIGELLERGDQAMYLAKKQGKGRVLCWRGNFGMGEAAEA
jgi:diguanylate cyclase (GGDEF)-like protein